MKNAVFRDVRPCDSYKNQPTNGWMDGWMDGWTDGRTDGWTDERMKLFYLKHIEILRHRAGSMGALGGKKMFSPRTNTKH
jgi:hypothetical protein